MSFLTFYQNGGIFMHLITLASVVALTTVLLHARARRMGSHDNSYLRFADRMAALAVGVGVVGALFGLMEMCYALSMIDPDKFDQAAARAGGIVPIPLNWALMCAIPIWLATTVQSQRSLPSDR